MAKPNRSLYGYKLEPFSLNCTHTFGSREIYTFEMQNGIKTTYRQSTIYLYNQSEITK